MHSFRTCQLSNVQRHGLHMSTKTSVNPSPVPTTPVVVIMHSRLTLQIRSIRAVTGMSACYAVSRSIYIDRPERYFCLCLGSASSLRVPKVHSCGRLLILKNGDGRFLDVVRLSALFTFSPRNPSYGFAACSHYNKIEAVARIYR